MVRGCPWQWMVAAPPLLLLLSVTAGHPDRGATRDRGTFLSSPSSNTQPESCQHATGQIRLPQPLPCYGLTGSWELPTAMAKPHTLFPQVAKGWATQELLARAPSVQVTAGKTLVVTHIAVGLVTWLGQDRCLLSIRETWVGQP